MLFLKSKDLQDLRGCGYIYAERKYNSQLTNANTLFSKAKLKYAEALLEKK
jgi:hypothetical protein